MLWAYFIQLFPDVFAECDLIQKIKIKSSLYSPYYAEACDELRGPFPRLSAWATQLGRNVATVASRWRHCVDLTGPGIEPQTSRTDSVRFATELTAGCDLIQNKKKKKKLFCRCRKIVTGDTKKNKTKKNFETFLMNFLLFYTFISAYCVNCCRSYKL